MLNNISYSLSLSPTPYHHHRHYHHSTTITNSLPPLPQYLHLVHHSPSLLLTSVRFHSLPPSSSSSSSWVSKSNEAGSLSFIWTGDRKEKYERGYLYVLKTLFCWCFSYGFVMNVWIYFFVLHWTDRDLIIFFLSVFSHLNWILTIISLVGVNFLLLSSTCWIPSIESDITLYLIHYSFSSYPLRSSI